MVGDVRFERRFCLPRAACSHYTTSPKCERVINQFVVQVLLFSNFPRLKFVPSFQMLSHIQNNNTKILLQTAKSPKQMVRVEGLEPSRLQDI